MLDSGQREQNYIHQRCHELIGCRPELTARQRRRINHKANKASGDAPRSRRQRFIRKLQAKLQPKPVGAKEALQRLQERRADRDPQSDTAQEIARRQRLRERVERHETSLTEAQAEILDEVAGKSLCATCEPSAPDWACRTTSGKKTKDHVGRVRH